MKPSGGRLMNTKAADPLYRKMASAKAHLRHGGNIHQAAPFLDDF